MGKLKDKISSKLIISLSIIFIIGLTVALWLNHVLLSSNTRFEESEKFIYIRKNADVSNWITTSDAQFIDNHSTFQTVASLKKFSSIKPGRYKIKRGMSNIAIVNLLRSGAQEPVNLRIDNVHDFEELAGKLGKHLMMDSTSFMRAFADDSTSASYGFDHSTFACMITPDTYDFFWTMSPDEFLARMKKIYDRYWTQEKRERAAVIGLTPNQAIILGSIVKAETAKKDEAPKIAGLYLNRLKIGMALQSDPTAVFGRKTHSQRIYLSDLRNDSPYNTYLHTGLPPGPIDFVEHIYIDAVLHSEKNNYLYMCAQPGGTGYHNFAVSLEQHNIYRSAYTNWLEKKGIR